MNKRGVVIEAIEFRPPPYVPWSIGLTVECDERLKAHLGTDDLSEFLDDHFVTAGSEVGRFEKLDADHVRDPYGVVWDRSVDKDIGNPVDWPIKDPADLDRYEWPDPANPDWYEGIPETLAASRDRFSRFPVGFSLYERAWTMRGMSDLLMDMLERPAFVDELFDQIVAHNMVQIRKGLDLDVDCVYFGDDYGMQTGLIMGMAHWRRFIKPRLAEMFEPVRAAGKCVMMHSCGKVQELFDDLAEIGLNTFNPFQPEVMDVFDYLGRYHGKLSFHGGMSIQKTLPFGSAEEVRDMARRLLEAGLGGGYVFSPSHAVPKDVPPENLVAMMEVLKGQDAYET